MIPDVYEPLSAYRDGFREKFASLTREKFEALTAASKIDVAANRALTKVIRKLESELESVKGKRTLFGWLLTLCFIGAIVCFGILAMNDSLNEEEKPLYIVGGLCAIVFGIWMSVLFSNAGDLVDSLKSQIKAAKDKAWKQMEALNRLYTWDITVKLIEATVPRLQFDPFFTARRLNDLERLYGWDGSFNDGKSIIFAQSGVINGNPFLFGEYREMEWGSETYHGTLDIEWEEEEEDSEGRVHLVTRHETLHASVTKPMPCYNKAKLLIYGNDAAPNLTFTHRPSGFDDDDLLDGIRKKWRLSRLKAYSRNLDDESQFTLMSNHEFETWFHAKDRNNEVEFRLLFTALAQTQMMALMKDRKVGFGDDFVFAKDHKLNYLISKHLSEATIDTDPAHFHHWSYDEAQKIFQSFNEKYFRDAYFALAPILAIPLYQQTRTHEEIWKGVLRTDRSSFWEHEAIANYYGDEHFRHPQCITENILKTRVVGREDGTSEVEVTAHGFRGVSRVDYVEVHGGDGHWHDVPVEWIEYLPVEKRTNMHISETVQLKNAIRRRSIYSALY